MDNLMKLVLAALEWSYEAKSTDVQEKWLEQAAELLALRHDTFQIIDGKGSGAEQASETEKEAASEIPAQQVSSPNEEQVPPSSAPVAQVKQARSREKEESQPVASVNCTFSGMVPIALQRFKQSGVSVVECPGCGRAWTLSPSGGVLRFKAHPKRKTNTPNAGRRWKRRGKGNRLECGLRVRKLACSLTWKRGDARCALAIRDHYYAYGRTRGFLTTHARLSEGLKGPAESSGLDLSCYDFCGCSRDSSPCEHDQLFFVGWKEGAAQAEQVYMQQDLDLVEDLGRAAGFTSRRPPRDYA